MQKIRIKVTVEPRSPLVLGAGMDAQNVRESRDFISGSLLRGALARVILSRSGVHRTDGLQGSFLSGQQGTVTPPAKFEAVFTCDDAARFGYLYPGYLPSASATVWESFPTPATAYCCKRHGARHRIVDGWRELLKQQLPKRACPDCNGRMERCRNFMLRYSDGDYGYRGTLPRRQLVRVGMNRWTEAAQDQVLYVLDAIQPKVDKDNPPLAFVGSWAMSEPQWASLQQLLTRYFIREDNRYSLRIGSAQARGLGEVWLRCEESRERPSLAEQLDRLQADVPDRNYLYFTFTARAPILVYDESGLPAHTLSPATLRQYSANLPTGLELVEHATVIERRTLSGWSQAWGLPKGVTSVMAEGSVFTYRVPLAEESAVLPFLKDLEANGIGERRGEGLGEVVACDPFHTIQTIKTK